MWFQHFTHLIFLTLQSFHLFKQIKKGSSSILNAYTIEKGIADTYSFLQ